MSISSDGFGSGVKVQRARGFVVGPGEAPNLPGTTGQLLASAADTGGLFTLIRTTADPGTQVPAHVHNDTDECFFVLTGQYEIQCATDHFKAGPGTFVYLPRGLPHSYTVGPDPATKLIFSVPGGIEHYFQDFGAGADTDALIHKHGVTYL